MVLIRGSTGKPEKFSDRIFSEFMLLHLNEVPEFRSFRKFPSGNFEIQVILALSGPVYQPGKAGISDIPALLEAVMYIFQ